jgi:hypothetical protein
LALECPDIDVVLRDDLVDVIQDRRLVTAVPLQSRVRLAEVGVELSELLDQSRRLGFHVVRR